MTTAHLDDRTTSDPMPHGILEEATANDGGALALHFKYSQSAELYYFITHDRSFVKGFKLLGMAQAVLQACRAARRHDYRTLVPSVIREYAAHLQGCANPTSDQITAVVTAALRQRPRR